MPSRLKDIPNDTSLIELFRYFETILPSDRSKIDWSVTTEFRVFSEYLIKDIQKMKLRLRNPDDSYLYYACRHIYNIQDWIKLITEDTNSPTFASTWESLFEKQFSDKHILRSMYDDCFEKWVSGKHGQHKIGENYYNILEGELYYRNNSSQWFSIEKETAFDLRPNKELIKNKNTIYLLDRDYKKTWYDKIYEQWKSNKYQGVLPKNFLEFNHKETDPDEYFEFSAKQIKALLKNPVSIDELKRWGNISTDDIEHIIKITTFILKTAAKRREDNNHTIYLLRDCLMFKEAQKIIDILDGEDTPGDQILIGRKLLSHKPGQWGYYAVTLDALFTAHLRYPDNFTEFYNEYARLMNIFVSVNSRFATIVENLANYIGLHLETDKNKIIVFDIGFQGSIALLTKYIIDYHIQPPELSDKIETDIEIGIGAEWSKKLFGHRHNGDCFPLLTHTQSMKRNNELYHYKEESLDSGKIRVVMGDKKAQHKAATELIILAMVALISQTEN